jgi:DNA-directed RNA polymerase subunit RPC12/RpoP
VTKPKKYQLNKGPVVKCPHCGSGTEIRSSREIDTLSRDVYYMCRDLDCGHQFVGQLTIKHSIVPSATPRAGVALPVYAQVPATASRPAPLPANDDTVPTPIGVPANDDSDDTAAAGDTIMTTPG